MGNYIFQMSKMTGISLQEETQTEAGKQQEVSSQQSQDIPTDVQEPLDEEIASSSSNTKPQESLEDIWKISTDPVTCEDQVETKQRQTGDGSMEWIRLRSKREADMIQSIKAKKSIQTSEDRSGSTRPCMNLIRGCDVNTTPSDTSKHELSCPFNKSIKLRVMGKLNILEASTKGFKPYCRTFEAKYDVSFMFKKCQNCDDIKVWVGGWTKKYNYKINLFASKPPLSIIWSASGTTHGGIETIPAELTKKHGNLIQYEVKLGK